MEHDYLKKLEELCDAAAGEPWDNIEVCKNDCAEWWAETPARSDECRAINDANFIAESRTAMPKLVKALKTVDKFTTKYCPCPVNQDTLCYCCELKKEIREILG